MNRRHYCYRVVRHDRFGFVPGTAFTLVEMLAALLCLTILIVMLTTAFNQGQRGWLYGENRVVTFQEARRALDSISADLSQAFAGGTIYFHGLSSSELRFIAPLNTSTNSVSAFCEVGYKFDATTGALLRQFTPPDPSYVGTSWNINGPLDANFASQTAILSNSVRTFRFDYYPPDSGTSSWPPSNALPTAIRVTLSTIDQHTAAKIKAGGDVSALTNQAERTFTTLIYLSAGKR
jgi:type II secretory pathway pseudopilin PulG